MCKFASYISREVLHKLNHFNKRKRGGKDRKKQGEETCELIAGFLLRRMFDVRTDGIDED
jgi:hypothetical protein